MKRLNFVLIILIYILNINVYHKESEYEFYQLLNEVQSYISFEENGVKVEYESNQSEEDELEDIKNILNKYKFEEYVLNKDEISIKTNSELIVASVFKNSSTTLVEIKIINYDNEKSISNLMKELTELQTNNPQEAKYFQFFKGKINNKENTIDNLSETRKLKNVETLEIHDGYVGKAILNDGQRVNFVASSYNTGSYFIIGTPIIFTTY